MKKLFVALSGGVDSSVAAALLVREGHDVTGVYMKNWSSSEGLIGDCPYLVDRRDAIRVAAHLGIPFREVDFEEQYRDQVYSYFVESYRRGRTPNPDVACNREIKFGLLLDYALDNGADFLATGHYARVREVTSSVTLSKVEGSSPRVASRLGEATPSSTDASSQIPRQARDDNKEAQRTEEKVTQNSSDRRKSVSPGGEFRLLRARDLSKDQSYFLHRLTQHQLSHALFPLGELKKSEVRALAREFGLPNAGRRDSQGLCFIGHVDLKDFLAREIPSEPGEVVDGVGERVGSHPGAAYYTIGQREGVGVALAEPKYVVATDVERNIVRLGAEAELYRREVSLENLHWIGDKPAYPLRCRVQIRYHAEPISSLLHKDGRLELEEPVRAPAPGQFVVFLDGERVLGGAEIV